MSDKTNQVTTVVSAFAVGALVGAAVAVLFAPRSGKETRVLLARKTVDLKDKVGDALIEAKKVIKGKKDDLVAAMKKSSKDDNSEHNPT